MSFLRELKKVSKAITEEYNQILIYGDGRAEVIEEKRKRIEVLKELIQYLKQGSWSNSTPQTVKTVLSLCMADDKKAKAEELGITYANAKVLLHRANKLLEVKIPSTLLSDIYNGDFNAASETIRILSGKSLTENLLLQEVLDTLDLENLSVTSEFVLGDCVTEIKFLSMYSKKMLSKRLDKIDKQKLDYLCYLLSTVLPDKKAEQSALLSVINGDKPITILDEIAHIPE